MTYGEIANIIAKQNGVERMSAQAVGGAVGHNPVSIIIPCHRVVGADGSLTGYAGGLDRKIELLKLEKALSKTFQASSVMNLVLFSYFRCKLHWGKLKFIPKFVRIESGLIESVRAIILSADGSRLKNKKIKREKAGEVPAMEGQNDIRKKKKECHTERNQTGDRCSFEADRSAVRTG